MTYTHQNTKVQAGGSTREGCLLFRDGALVAVLVKLSQEDDGGLTGKWFLEACFGLLDDPAHPVFDDMNAAEQWLDAALSKV